MKNRLSRIPALIALPLLLAACGGLLTSEQPPRQVYLLQPLSAVASGGEGAAVLQFSLDVIPGLDTDRILALDPDARLVPYANARWPDHLPEVLGSVLSRSLEATGRYGQIGSAALPAPNDWVLELELRSFYGMLDSAGGTQSVRAELAGKLHCNGVTRTLDLSDNAPVRENRLAAIVAAHQAALDSVTRALIERLAEDCRSDGA